MDGKLLHRFGVLTTQSLEAADTASGTLSRPPPRPHPAGEVQRCAAPLPHPCVAAEEAVTVHSPGLNWPFCWALIRSRSPKELYDSNWSFPVPWQGLHFCQRFVCFRKTGESTSRSEALPRTAHVPGPRLPRVSRAVSHVFAGPARSATLPWQPRKRPALTSAPHCAW